MPVSKNDHNGCRKNEDMLWTTERTLATAVQITLTLEPLKVCYGLGLLSLKSS